MILTGMEILKEVGNKKITLNPFAPEQVTTNSYDLRLGDQFLRYAEGVIDVKQKPQFDIQRIPDEGLLLNAGDFVLAETYEQIGSDCYVPLIHGRSGTARAGLFVHITADLIDIGSKGKSTLQLFATVPIRIYRRMKIAQVTFWTTQGDINLYNGKYQGSDGPMASMIYRDFEESE